MIWLLISLVSLISFNIMIGLINSVEDVGKTCEIKPSPVVEVQQIQKSLLKPDSVQASSSTTLTLDEGSTNTLKCASVADMVAETEIVVTRILEKKVPEIPVTVADEPVKMSEKREEKNRVYRVLSL